MAILSSCLSLRDNRGSRLRHADQCDDHAGRRHMTFKTHSARRGTTIGNLLTIKELWVLFGTGSGGALVGA